MTLIGLILVKTRQDDSGNNGLSDQSLAEYTKNYTRTLAPIALPLIRDIPNI